MKLLVLCLALLTSCATLTKGPTNATGDQDGLRTREGVCSTAGFGQPFMQVCFRIGAVKTLYDDDVSRAIVMVHGQTIDHANPARYQFTITKDGQQVAQWIGASSVPNPSEYYWWAVDTHTMTKPFSNGKYEISWVDVHNVDVKGESTITLSGLSGPTPCFEWQKDYEECKSR